MKNISNTLRAFKENTLVYNQAELFNITLRNGRQITATSWPLDIPDPNIPGTVYYATRWGIWSHGPTTSEMMFSLSSNDFKLNVNVPTVALTNLIQDSDGSLGLWNNNGLTYASSGGPNGGGTWSFLGGGAPSGFHFNISPQPIVVIPGQTYTLSAWVDATQVTAGSVFFELENISITTGYGGVSVAAGTKGRFSVAITIPAGVTQALAIFDTNNVTIANGQRVLFSEPQLELGSVATAYQSSSDNVVVFPGSNTTIIPTVAYGLFDGASVDISRAYGPVNKIRPDLTLGTEVIGAGKITRVENLWRAGCEFSVSDYLYLANQNIPQDLVQANCRFTLFDTDGRVGCKLNKAGFVTNVTAAGGSSSLIIQLASALANAAPYYDQGVMTCLTGNNAGLSTTIKKQLSTTALQMVVPWILPVQTGDTFSIAPGCDKTLATCLNKFNNKINFGGFPFVQPPETVL